MNQHIMQSTRLYLRETTPDDVPVVWETEHLLHNPNKGFVEEGTLRESLKTGDVYESVAVMSILKNEYV